MEIENGCLVIVLVLAYGACLGKRDIKRCYYVYNVQLSTPSGGQSALDTSQRDADAGRDDRQRRDAAATGRGQTGVNYKVTEYTHEYYVL